jgi:trimethylamine--corrinoid protein Co-methyltransferase
MKRAGRQARVEARKNKAAMAHKQAPSHARRQHGVFELLSEAQLQQIEANADRILANIGMEFRGDEEALQILSNAGCRIEGERAYFPTGMCRQIIQDHAPSEFTQHARNPERSVRIGGNNTVFCPSFGPPFVHDMEKGRRYGTIEDVQNFTKLHYMLPAVHHSGGVVCEPTDLHVRTRHLHLLHAHLTLSDKPLMGSVTAPERAQDSIDMVKIAMGDAWQAENCYLYSVVNPNSPLVLDDTMLGALKVYAKSHQAVVVSSFLLTGAMSPVSIAGTLSQLLAEVSAGLCLVQLINPGNPCVFGTFSSPISLQTGAPTFGTPEGLQIQYGAAQLARRLGVPFHSVGSLTASKVPDSQAAYESAMQLDGAYMAGANFIIHATGCLEGLLCTGYEKLVMDADRCAAYMKFAQGVDTSEAAMAYEALTEVGPGGHYLGCAHTQANFETAFYHAHLADNQTYEQWQDKGADWQHQQAHKRWQQLLNDYQPPAMALEVRQRLDEFVQQRTHQLLPNSNN